MRDLTGLLARVERLEATLEKAGIVTIQLDGGGSIQLGRLELADAVFAALDYNYNPDEPVQLPDWWEQAAHFVPQDGEPVIAMVRGLARHHQGLEE